MIVVHAPHTLIIENDLELKLMKLKSRLGDLGLYFECAARPLVLKVKSPQSGSC